jgi:hypothetical protein
MSEGVPWPIVVLIAFVVGICAAFGGYTLAVSDTNDRWRRRLIDKGCAVWGHDPDAGETRFVYACGER